MKTSVLVGIGAAFAVLALAACSSDRSGDCPTITGVTDASVATTFRPGAAPDSHNVLYTVELTGVTGTCDMDKSERWTDANLHLKFRAIRPPSGVEAHYTIPYFVAVTEGRRVLARRTYSVRIDFAPGETTAAASDTVGSAHLDVAKDKHPYDYQVLAGLQLSRAQLDYNRRSGHYGP